MPQNQYLPIANGIGANALTPSAWAALAVLLSQGFQSGVVPSNQFNTFLRQFSIPTSALAQFIADNQAADVLDDGVVANFEAKFKAALQNTAAYVDQGGLAVSFTAGGTATAYTGALAPIPNSLTPEMEALGYFGTANTSTTPTLNLNNLGAKPILKQGGGAPAAGDVVGFVPLILNTTGTAWVINGLVASDVNNFVAPHAGRLIAVQTFTSSGTYTPSTGMTYIVVEGVGGGAAGGGAGGATSTFVSLGAPGTAGCYGRAFYTAAQIGASQTVTIGAGGAPVSGGVGGNGGQTYFGSLLGLPGGVGGNTLTNQTAPTVNGNGATSAAGTGANITQTPGGVSSVSTAYTSNVGASGAGGNSLLGTGGYVVFINSTAAAGTGFGAGGGTVIVNASGGTLFGGAGSGGKLIITEYGY